jgi:hypothetical protein
MVLVCDYPKFFAAPSQSAAEGIVATALLMDVRFWGAIQLKIDDKSKALTFEPKMCEPARDPIETRQR